MAENDFLPIAVEGAPNVQSQADYAGSRQQQQGFAVGEIPTSPAWNKMLRQSSCVMALLAQLIVNNTGQDMLDNGDQAAKLLLLSSMFRVMAVGDMTFNIANAPTGNDATGDGSAGAPWATLQHALDTVATRYDGSGFNLTVKAAAGTYAPMNSNIAPIGWKTIKVVGVTGAPTTCSIHATAAGADAFAVGGYSLTVDGFQLKSDFGGGISAAYGATVVYQNMDFGACSLFQVAGFLGAYVQNGGPCTVSGNATSLGFAGNGAQVIFGAQNITFSVAVTYAQALMFTNAQGGITVSGPNFINPGNVIGRKYLAQGMSLINTGTGDVNYLPGSLAGIANQGSNYL